MKSPKLTDQLLNFWQSAKQMAKSGSSVAQQLSSVHAKQVEVNRRNVQRIIEAILFLGRQNIAFRGHNESSKSLNKGTVPARGNVKMKRVRTHLVANSNAFAFTTPK